MNSAVFTFPAITGLAAVLVAGLATFLSLRVSLLRNRIHAPFGDAGDARLLSRMRAHGNLVENAPLFLILLGGRKRPVR